MIIDSINRWRQYAGMSKGLTVGFEFLNRDGLENLEDGRYDLESDCFAIVQRYITKSPSEGRWEAHRKFIDIQYVVSGCEVIGWSAIESLTEDEAYDPDKDITRPKGDGSFLTLTAGHFAVFHPSDAHMPSLSPGQATSVMKVVVKVPA